MREKIKSIIRKAQLWDFFWSIPLSFLIFFAYGYISENYFGDPFYSTEWIHRAFLTATILVIANGFIMGFMWFNHRGHFRNYYGKVGLESNNIPSWIKLYTYPFFYFLMLVIFVILFKAIS